MSYEQEPLYIQIKQHLLNQIHTGKVKPGEKLPSEKELTDLFSVSRITVRNALAELQSEGMISRVSGKGTFVSQLSQNMISRPVINNIRKISDDNTVLPVVRQIGVIMCNLNAPFQVQLMVSIEQEIYKHGFQMIFGLTNGDSEIENNLIEQMLQAGVTGLIIYPTDGKFYNEEILRLSIENFPIVLIDRYLPGINTCSVYSDDRQGAYDIGQYLGSKGHSNIALLSPAPGQTIPLLNRIDGFSEALIAGGITIKSELWITELLNSSLPDEDNKHIENINRIEKLLKEHTEITAIYAINSLIALMAYRATLNLGYIVPEDIEIVCFDNTTGYFSIEDYKISYIEHSERDMGRIAVESVVEMINGGKPGNTMLPCKLIKK